MAEEADLTLAACTARQHGVFTLDDARAAGLSEAQISRREACEWQRIHERVFRAAAAPMTWHGDLLAACYAAEAKPAAVSHWALAGLHGLPMGRIGVVEILCRRWKRTRKSGLIVHESTRLDEIDVIEFDGIPVTTPERMVLDLAGQRPYVDFVERVLQAARRKRLITYESTLATFSRLRRRGLPGVGAMAEAMERWNPDSRPTHSDMEVRVLQILRDHGLPEPTTQFEVRDRYGNLVATTDLGLGRWQVVIEYQSDQEHSDEFQIARDDRRRNKIIGAGYKPIMARKHDVWSGGRELVDEILEAARQPA
jgi:hypothetical protein